MLGDPIKGVRAAAAAREGALAAFRHSPNGETIRVLRATKSALDYRLEQLWSSMDDTQRAEAASR